MLIEEVGNFLGKYKCSIIHGNFPDLCCSWKTLYFSWMNVKVLTDPIKLFWRERRKNKHKILITRKLSNTVKVGIFFPPYGQMICTVVNNLKIRDHNFSLSILIVNQFFTWSSGWILFPWWLILTRGQKVLPSRHMLKWSC